MFTNNSRIIFLNRFLSLIIEYGYAIALSIIFSKISVDYVLGLWIAKFLGGILANVGHQFVGKITNKKYVLIGIELLKAVCLALIYLAMGSVFVFALVVLTEVLTTYFNSLLSSAVPVLVKKANLQKFNSTYTMIGSASYFLAPMIVGLWGSLDLGSLFLVYSVLTLLATLLLFKLGPIIFDRENESEEEVSSSQGSPIFGRQSVVLKMVMMTILLQSVGVLYDAYEVIFLTKDVGISSQSYSFSLSFLAIAFLATSSILSFKSLTKYSPMTVYLLGSLVYLGYVVVFPFVPNLPTVLLSYIFLAVGQTISGISQNVYLQEKLNPLQLNNLYLKIEVLNQVLTGIVVFVSGMLIKRGLQVTTIYLGYSIPIIVLVLGIMLMTKLYQKNLKS